MDKIVTTEQAIQISNALRTQNRSLVIAGGCFDILHVGHTKFLKKAKQEGDVLMILLEHDETIKKKKGEHRPLNHQADRAELLAHLALVDYILMLPPITTDDFYDKLVIQLKPAIIATTAGDPYRTDKERSAKKIGATVVDVIQPVTNQSTTRVVQILKEL